MFCSFQYIRMQFFNHPNRYNWITWLNHTDLDFIVYPQKGQEANQPNYVCLWLKLIPILGYAKFCLIKQAALFSLSMPPMFPEYIFCMEASVAMLRNCISARLFAASPQEEFELKKYFAKATTLTSFAFLCRSLHVDVSLPSRKVSKVDILAGLGRRMLPC